MKIFILLCLGLEYIVEIHHNTVKSVDHSYHCLLCNVPIKSGKVDRIIYPIVLTHVKTIGHKLNYLVSVNYVLKI